MELKTVFDGFEAQLKSSKALSLLENAQKNSGLISAGKGIFYSLEYSKLKFVLVKERKFIPKSRLSGIAEKVLPKIQKKANRGLNNWVHGSDLYGEEKTVKKNEEIRFFAVAGLFFIATMLFLNEFMEKIETEKNPAVYAIAALLVVVALKAESLAKAWEESTMAQAAEKIRQVLEPALD